MADRWSRRTRTNIGGAAGLIAVLIAPVVAAAQDQSSAAADRGRQLFAGTARFANGGPACAECHDVAGVPFPHGGSVGPDLSRAYSKYGPEPLDTVLSTLYFPTMQALFAQRVLTQEERRDLTAFFQRADTLPAHRAATLVFAVAGIAGAIALLGAASFTWRGRLRGVRRSLASEARRRTGA